MNVSSLPLPARQIAPAPAVSSARALRRLFMTLYLRGRGSRGLNKE